MRQRARMTQTVDGSTKTVVLSAGTIGWEVKAWKHQVGDVKSMAEGNPYLHETFSEYADAVATFRVVCHAAVDNPDPKIVTPGPMVDLAAQERIDDASKLEHSERERDRLDQIFTRLHQETR